MGDDLLTAIGIATGIVVSLFALGTATGVVLLARRARRQAVLPPSGYTTAGAALVRADDILREARDDLAFAEAQFGPERTIGFREAVARADADLRRAFHLRQRVDVEGAGERRRREWTREASAIATRLQREIEEERRRFVQLRDAESNAGEHTQRLRSRLAELRQHRAEHAEVLTTLTARYAPEALMAVSTNPGRIDEELAAAEAILDEVSDIVSTSTVTAVTHRLDAARENLAAASSLIGAIGSRRDELGQVESALEALRAEATAALAAARVLRDDPPDPESGASVGRAVSALDAELAAARGSGTARRNPIAALDALVDAVDGLDAAVAAAINQRRRLDGARGALDGALVSARSQIASVRDYVETRRGSVGVGARTRLAEAERELLLAENESDPVAALDAARRAQTHARDADALARYSG